jgi:hypothetical protein
MKPVRISQEHESANTNGGHPHPVGGSHAFLQVWLLLTPLVLIVSQRSDMSPAIADSIHEWLVVLEVTKRAGQIVLVRRESSVAVAQSRRSRIYARHFVPLFVLLLTRERPSLGARDAAKKLISHC